MAASKYSTYPEHKKAGIRAATLRWYHKNKERTREKNKRRYYENLEESRKRSREYIRLWRSKNPDAATRTMWKRRGLPEPTRPRPETCECCGKPPGKYSLCLDHCHGAGFFRGWLCTRCNAGIGALGDNEDGLMKAIAYLRKTKCEFWQEQQESSRAA